MLPRTRNSSFPEAEFQYNCHLSTNSSREIVVELSHLLFSFSRRKSIHILYIIKLSSFRNQNIVGGELTATYMCLYVRFPERKNSPKKHSQTHKTLNKHSEIKNFFIDYYFLALRWREKSISAMFLSLLPYPRYFLPFLCSIFPSLLPIFLHKKFIYYFMLLQMNNSFPIPIVHRPFLILGTGAVVGRFDSRYNL